MKRYNSESDHIPPEWDTTSSRISVYHNYNIEQIERHDDTDESENPRIAYTYKVDEYTKEEYTQYLLEKNRADIDYLSIMMGVELNV